MVKGRHHISGYSALYDFSIDRSISKCGDRSGKSKLLWRSKIDSLHSEYRYAVTRELWYKIDTIFDQINLLENLLIENCYVKTTVNSVVQIFIK
jgi:hypothetical protein